MFLFVLSGTVGEAEKKSSQKAEKADAQHDSIKAKYESAQGLNAQINTHLLQLPMIQIRRVVGKCCIIGLAKEVSNGIGSSHVLRRNDVITKITEKFICRGKQGMRVLNNKIPPVQSWLGKLKPARL